MRRHTILLFLLFTSLHGYGQSKLPAMFYNYNKFYTEFSKLNGYKHIDYENSSCRKYSEWKLTISNDSLEAYISIGSKPEDNANVGITITIGVPYNIWNNWGFRNEVESKITSDLRHVINDERFSVFNPEIGISGDRVDNSTGLLVSVMGVVTSSSDTNGIRDLRNYTTTTIDVCNPEIWNKNISINYGPDLEDTTTVLILPIPELPDSSASNPATLFQSVLAENSIIKPFIEQLMGGTFSISFENDIDLNYSINTNPQFNCAGNDTSQSNIEFTLNGDCFETGGFLNLSYECSGQKPEPTSWAHYLSLADSIAGYLNVDKPVVYTNYNIGKYTYASQTISPAYKKCVKYSFGKSNCYLPCGVMDKTYFSADIYFCGCSFEYIK
jgi:hypothetical protein